MERIKDFLLMEEELIRNQEQLRPQEKKNEVRAYMYVQYNYVHTNYYCTWALAIINVEILYVCLV